MENEICKVEDVIYTPKTGGILVDFLIVKQLNDLTELMSFVDRLNATHENFHRNNDDFSIKPILLGKYQCVIICYYRT